MPRSKKPGPSVKDDEVYEAIRDEGGSKEKAARIANASANTSRASVGKKGGESGSYDDWTRDELRKRAAELDVAGRSSMSKAELVKALRDR
ncbi:MAG: Rho termination factor [Nocardioidaceae bacterium]|nr:Rho termination factor [Nocardioidaceae bacterium]